MKFACSSHAVRMQFACSSQVVWVGRLGRVCMCVCAQPPSVCVRLFLPSHSYPCLTSAPSRVHASMRARHQAPRAAADVHAVRGVCARADRFHECAGTCMCLFARMCLFTRMCLFARIAHVYADSHACIYNAPHVVHRSADTPIRTCADMHRRRCVVT